MARRSSLAVFVVALLILSPLAFGFLVAGNGHIGYSDAAGIALAGLLVLAVAATAGLAAGVAVHMLAREARARRRG